MGYQSQEAWEEVRHSYKSDGSFDVFDVCDHHHRHPVKTISDNVPQSLSLFFLTAPANKPELYEVSENHFLWFNQGLASRIFSLYIINHKGT